MEGFLVDGKCVDIKICSVGGKKEVWGASFINN